MFKGINGTTLEILGQIEAKVSGKDFDANGVTLRVVLNYAMKCEMILERDAIKLLGLMLVKRKEERKEIAVEILNAERIEK